MSKERFDEWNKIFQGMKTCIDCGSKVDWNPRSSLCEQCYDEQLKMRLKKLS